MRRHSRARVPVVVTLPLLLGACAGEPAAEEAPVGAADAAGAAAATPRPDTTRMYMVRLDGQRRPDLIGSAGFVPAGEETLVVAGIRGATAGGTLQGHIHQGETCDSPGDPAIPLEDLRVGPDGVGRTTTTISATISGVFDGGHLVVYHEEGGQPGPAVVCGDIPVLVPLDGEAGEPGS